MSDLRTEEKLLKVLADRVGIQWKWQINDYGFSYRIPAFKTQTNFGIEYISWNPLRNDHEVMQLALNLDLVYFRDENCVGVSNKNSDVLVALPFYDSENSSSMQVLRKAIVMAAVELVELGLDGFDIQI